VHEGADLIFHTMVLLAAKGVKLEEVMEELRLRRR
jgi:phosphoribosyl-ATP pyrophosphohydrolase